MPTDACADIGNYMDLLLDTVCVIDRDGRFVHVSAGSERLFGYTPAELVGRPMIDLVHPADRERTLQEAADIMTGAARVGFRNRYLRKDGRVAHIQWSARWSARDQRRVGVARDVSELQRAEALQAALYAISEAAHTCTDLPALFARIRHTVAELVQAHLFTLALADADGLHFPCRADTADAADAERLCAEIVAGGQALQRQDADGQRWLGVPLCSGGQTMGALLVHGDTPTARHNAQDMELLQFVSTQVATAIERGQWLARLQHMALYDQLTQLPNRELLHDRLQRALARARREDLPLALLYLDLDKFKQVNDRLGHAAGDTLLQQTARRIAGCLREADTVARLGGDEFVVLLEDIGTVENALAVAETIRGRLNQPFALDEGSARVLPSIGLALFPLHGQEAAQLLRHADQAMYLAKAGGGNRLHSSGTARPGART